MVRAARARREPLYPTSTGMNWGYGSAQAPVAGCTRIDLSAMRAIRNAAEISLANPVAVIEPGVTQGQLHDFLQQHCPALTFNVTGSAVETSVLGNALDRGVGYQGPRHQDIFGLEVVTGQGEVLRTGFRRLGESSPLAHTHPCGLGPMLDGLFSQGNFGIVTSACFRLVPRRPCEVAVSMALRDAQRLPEFIDLLAQFKREGLIQSVNHIGNRARTRSTLMHGVVRYLVERCAMTDAQARVEAQAALALAAPQEWTSLGAVTGNTGQVRAAVIEMRRRVRGLARLMVVTERRLDWAFKLVDRLRSMPPARRMAAVLSAIRPLHGLCLGRPTDVAVDNLLWQFGAPQLSAAEFERSDCGLLYISPALPMDGQFVARMLDELQCLAQTHGHSLYITVNIETPTSMVAVINLLFDRRDAEQQARAQRCADEMNEHLRRAGLEVYRAHVDMMAGIVARDPEHWRIVRSLKLGLDPDNIIAPGRYNLPG